jgi:hypothetical protein
MAPIPQHYDPVKRQTGFRAIPVNKLVDGMTVPAPGIGAGRAIQDCDLRMFKFGETKDGFGLLRLNRERRF